MTAIRKIILKCEKALKYNQSIIETEIETMLEICPDDSSDEQSSDDETTSDEERSDDDSREEKRNDKSRSGVERREQNRDNKARSDAKKGHEERSDENKNDENRNKEDETKRPIKDASPFSTIFEDLYEKCLKEVEDQTIKLDKSKARKNKYYSLEFLKKLLSDYMPYCFIWASFSFEGLSFSRITNGAIENYNGFRKRNVKKKPPHRYIDSNFEMIQGACIQFIESSVQEKQPIKTKKNKRRPRPSLVYAEAAEENEFESVEKYRKISLAPANDYGYQRQVVFNENISLLEQTEIEFRNYFYWKFTE